MFRSKMSRWIVLGSLAALLAAAGVAVAADAAGDGGGRKGNRRGRFARFLKDRRERMAHNIGRTMDRLDALSDEQAKTALEVSLTLVKMREEARGKVAAILVQAHREGKGATPEQRTALRQATREKLKALRDQYRPAFTEAGMKVVRSLTPEQRSKIEEAAKARGKAVDDEKLARWFGMRLSHPMAAALLRARLEAPAATAPATTPANK
jgi:hypothetical protein